MNRGQGRGVSLVPTPLRGYVGLGALRLQSPQSVFLVLVDENG